MFVYFLLLKQFLLFYFRRFDSCHLDWLCSSRDYACWCYVPLHQMYVSVNFALCFNRYMFTHVNFLQVSRWPEDLMASLWISLMPYRTLLEPTEVPCSHLHQRILLTSLLISTAPMLIEITSSLPWIHLAKESWHLCWLQYSTSWCIELLPIYSQHWITLDWRNLWSNRQCNLVLAALIKLLSNVVLLLRIWSMLRPVLS